MKANGSRANHRVRAALGLRLRTFRKEAGFSQERLGVRAKLSGKFIGEVERGEKSVSVDSLCLIARALSTSIRTLVVDIDRRETPSRDVEHVLALIRKQPTDMQGRIRKVVHALVQESA